MKVLQVPVLVWVRLLHRQRLHSSEELSTINGCTSQAGLQRLPDCTGGGADRVVQLPAEVLTSAASARSCH